MELDGRLARGDETCAPGQQLVWHRPPWHEPEVPLHFDGAARGRRRAGRVETERPADDAGRRVPGAHAAGAGAGALRGDAHPLHRLGRFTSGVVLFARTPRRGGRAGSRAWRAHEVTKDYRALVAGAPPWERVTIDDADRTGAASHARLRAAARARRPAVAQRLTVVERRARRGDDAVRRAHHHGTAASDPHSPGLRPAIRSAGDPLYAAGGQPRAESPACRATAATCCTRIGCAWRTRTAPAPSRSKRRRPSRADDPAPTTRPDVARANGHAWRPAIA